MQGKYRIANNLMPLRTDKSINSKRSLLFKKCQVYTRQGLSVNSKLNQARRKIGKWSSLSRKECLAICDRVKISRGKDSASSTRAKRHPLPSALSCIFSFFFNTEFFLPTCKHIQASHTQANYLPLILNSSVSIILPSFLDSCQLISWREKLWCSLGHLTPSPSCSRLSLLRNFFCNCQNQGALSLAPFVNIKTCAASSVPFTPLSDSRNYLHISPFQENVFGGGEARDDI